MKENMVYFYPSSLFSFLILPFFLIGFAPRAFGQQALQDSLELILDQKDLSTHEKALTLSRLAEVISYKNLQKGIRQNRDVIRLAKDHQDAEALSFAWSQQVVLDVRSGKISQAGRAVDSALYYARHASALVQGLAFYRKGYVENIQNRPDQALLSWQKALSYLNKPGGALYQAGIYYLLYGIYAERNDTVKAGQYAHLALRKARQSREPGILAASWQINGTYYMDRYRRTPDSVMLDSALYAFQQSVRIFQQQQNRIKNPGVVALAALNLAEIYLDHFPPWYKDSILNNVNLALKVSYTTRNAAMQANSYEIISKLNKKEGNLAAAEKALLREKKIVDSLKPANYYLSMNLYQSLAQLKEQQGDKTHALAYYKQYLYFYQKEFDARQYKTIQDLEARYQNEKKDKKLKLLQQRNAFQKKQTYLYTGIAIIAVIGLLLLFAAYHFRLKYAIQREQLKDEETARLRAEQNLMQSEKEQLQKELLAGALQVEHKNEMLQDLKKKLREQAGGQTSVTLEKILNEEMRVDEDFENIRSELQELHPQFFSRLQEKAHQKLTQLDLKYCAYINMKLTTKQIAGLMHVEPKSVRMAKYRLKQKLGLTKEESLELFIQSL